MISAGTARRNAGSAVKRRRYAGLAIDWASPLIESDRIDALAASARAIAGLRFGSSPPRPEGCAASLRITFIGIEKRGLVESPGVKDLDIVAGAGGLELFRFALGLAVNSRAG